MCNQHYNKCGHSIRGQYNTMYCGKIDPSMSHGIRCEVQRAEEECEKMNKGMMMEQTAMKEFMKVK